MKRFRAAIAMLTACGVVAGCGTPRTPNSAPRIRTVMGGEYWGVPMTPEYTAYLARLQPDLIHAGVLGPELASGLATRGAHTQVTPIAPPGVATMREFHDWWKKFLVKIHRRAIFIQATFSMVNVWGDHRANTGWFKYYNDLWEEAVIGPRPCPHATDLLERNARGELLRTPASGWGQYRGCVNNPHWRQALKGMVRAGIASGFDGFMVQFPHARGECACTYCQQRFRAFLRAKYSREELQRRFGIADLDHHTFEVTAPRPDMRTPLDSEARQFGAVCVKECFDEVFIDYGRGLKPDLVVSLWTHFRQFLTEGLPTDGGYAGTNRNTDIEAYMDERATLPADMWGRGESYIWYSDPIYRSNLKEGLAGDATLESKYLRSMCGAIPFVAQKYDYFRWRLTAMEPIALGGAAFGAWQGGWSGGRDREQVHMLSYCDFIRAADRYLRSRESFAEIALLFPRRALYNGDAAFFEPVRRLGRGLIAGHILFDILVDEKMAVQDLERYRVILLPETKYLTAQDTACLRAYAAAGGVVLAAPNTGQSSFPVMQVDIGDKQAVAQAVRKAAGDYLARFDAPWTVQVNADRQPATGRILVHFVNYNRDEKREGFEAPIAAAPVGVDLCLPGGFQVRSVHFLTPEVKGATKVEFQQVGARLKFATPGFLVYGLAVIER